MNHPSETYQENINLSSLIQDLATTLSEPDKLIELYELGSKTNPGMKGSYLYQTLTPAEYQRIVNVKRNVHFVSGIDRNYETRKKDGGRVSAEFVKEKSWMVFECDFKDIATDLSEWTQERKREFAVTCSKHREAIEGVIGNIWLVVFSGNGLHFYVKLDRVITVGKYYKKVYEEVCRQLEEVVKLKFDRSFSSLAQGIRMPLSWNCKVEPVKSEALWWNNNVNDKLRLLIEELGEGFSRVEIKQKVNKSDSAVTRINKELKWEVVLKHFGYEKTLSSMVVNGNGVKARSPWTDDEQASCVFYDEYFKDFSSSVEGDKLNFMAMGLYGDSGTKGERFKEVVALGFELLGEKVPSRESNKQEHAGYQEYVELLKEVFPDFRRDLFSEKLMVSHRGKWRSIKEKQIFATLKSICRDIPRFAQTAVEDHIERWCDTLKPELLIDIPKWDGRDRVREIAQVCEVEDYSKDDFEDIIKNWGSNCIRRLYDPWLQNRCLILQGEQGIGKDDLIEALVGGFGQLLSNISINATGNEKDLLMILNESAVIKISEWERTNKIESAMLKDVLTKPMAKFRRPYGEENFEATLRCSFISSCNTTNFFRDHTGARRFAVVRFKGKKGEAIKYCYSRCPDYPHSKEDKLQVLAQFKELNPKVTVELENQIEKVNSVYTPRNPELEILDDFDELIKQKLPSTIPVANLHFYNHQLTDEFNKIGKTFGYSPQYIRSILKKQGRAFHDWRGRGYFGIDKYNETPESLDNNTPF